MGKVYVIVPVNKPGLTWDFRSIVHRCLDLRYQFSSFRYNYLERLGSPAIACIPRRLRAKMRGRKFVTGRVYIEVLQLGDGQNAS